MGIKIGIIGGSGLDNLNIFTNARDTFTGTVWGEPSSPLREGEIAGIPVAVLARHGRSHTIAPSSVNYRANIQTLKDAGCTHILATTATGSLREEIRRGDLVILDQFIDFTKQRKMTFHDYFKPGQPVHAPMAEPFDATLRQILIDGCRKNDFPFHPTGTVVTIEGPRFSTKAESRMFRMWGADVINMSVSTETALANEAGIPYAAVAMSTDYDCWKEDEAPVSWEEVSLVFKQNAEKVTTLLVESVPAIAQAALKYLHPPPQRPQHTHGKTKTARKDSGLSLSLSVKQQFLVEPPFRAFRLNRRSVIGDHHAFVIFVTVAISLGEANGGCLVHIFRNHSRILVFRILAGDKNDVIGLIVHLSCAHIVSVRIKA